MQVLLVGINAKFVHTNLALDYLSNACPCPVTALEFTINESERAILAKIAAQKADLVGFSCYIWNWDLIVRLTENLHKIQPEVKILLGGPEVSYDSEDILKQYPWVDFIIRGPGELPWQELLTHWPDFSQVPSLVWHSGGVIKSNPLSSDDWEQRTSPFASSLQRDYSGKNIYYETSRGCPYRCSYCLSGEDKLRFLPLDRVKRELMLISESGAKQIKFVDRTFNCRSDRAVAIWNYIMALEHRGMNYHFEISADLLNEEMLQALSKAPSGLFNLEIGIQTVHEATLKAVHRRSRLEKAFYWIKRILQETKVHVHLDLIIGLPYEAYEQFQVSFNEVVALAPHKLQIGFLKLLRGSRIRREAELYDYQYTSYPPYEILSNRFITYEEISFLHNLEHVFDKYYNSGRFYYILKYLAEFSGESYFSFYAKLTVYWQENDYFSRSVGLEECYSILADFIRLKYSSLVSAGLEVLRFDYLLHKNQGNLPAWCGKVYNKADKLRHRSLLSENTGWHSALPELAGLTWKEQLQKSHSDLFQVNVLDGFKQENCLALFYYGEEPTFCLLSEA